MRGLNRPHTEKEKKHLSKIAKERGFGKWMKGKSYSDERNRRVLVALIKAYQGG